jgi:peptidoglycan/xylan/chitin deacetylase (PgdA/CDA1 family)
MLTLGVVVFWLIPGAIGAWVVSIVVSEYRRDRIPILLYHRFLSRRAAARGEVRDDEMIFVSYGDAFAEQMRFLSEAGYTTIDFDEYVEIRAGRKELPEKPIIVTIDDGYGSTYRIAYPEIRRNGLRATVFVALEPDAETRSHVEGVDDFLSPDQIREMSSNGISFQSHTLTHCILAELDEDAARFELAESRGRIEAITGHPVRHIAIPRAGYSRRTRAVVESEAFLTACCNRKGSANLGTDPLALPRIVIERDMTISEFARCLTPKHSVVLRIIGTAKRIPEFMGGSRFARRVRSVLYGGPAASLFRARNLKIALALVGAGYLLGTIWFTAAVLIG